jgi:SAM-dependent methyltransferase
MEASEFFTRAMMGYRATKVLLVANRIGIFDALANGPMRASALAEEIGVDPEKLTILLHALTGMELLVMRADAFENAPLAAEYLVSAQPKFLGHNLRFQDMLWDCWSKLEDVVRSGRPHRELAELLGREDLRFTEQYIRGMHDIAVPSAREVARILRSTGPSRSLLDVGGGPGTYALELLTLYPQATATLLDLESTLTVTREIVRDHPLRARLDLRACDYLSDDYGRGFDLVLMSHVTHDEDPESVQRMFRAAYAALEPGGRIAVHDWVVEASKHAPLSSALFSVNLMVYTKGGRIYSAPEYRGLLAASGFEDLAEHGVLEGTVANPTRLIIASRPRNPA